MNDKIDNKHSPIVIGSVIETDNKKGLTVKLDDGRIGHVEIDQISDIDIGPIESYFKLFPKYKFKVIKNNDNDPESTLNLSYKMCHPKLMGDKKKIVPTCNHFNTLKKMIWFEIFLYDKQNNLNELTTKKLNDNLPDIEIVKKDNE